MPVLAALALSGCTTKKAEAPEVSGPSELGLSLEFRATPDVVTMDGQSQSQLVITARDSGGRPVGNQSVRVEITAGSQIVDFGRLSTKNVTTGSDGRATVTYTAPAGSPSQNSDDFTVITLIATPIGNDYRNALARQVDIRLVPQGVILPISGAPVPKFVSSPAQPSEEGEVAFDASATIPACNPDPTAPNDVTRCTPVPGTIVSYAWDFGNGQTGSGVRASTRYSLAGSYVVRLTVVNDRGFTNSVTGTVNVGAVAGPSADFAISPTNPVVNQNVFFDANASRPANGRTIARYDWDFGDGHFGSGVTASHRYAYGAQTFNITLTVTDSAGKTGAATKALSVDGGTIAANFTFSPSQPTVNTRVYFDASTSVPPPGRTIVRYEWNFGDNVLAEGVRTDYSYRNPGAYAVVLSVTDNTGAKHTTSKTVTVQ